MEISYPSAGNKRWCILKTRLIFATNYAGLHHSSNKTVLWNITKRPVWYLWRLCTKFKIEYICQEAERVLSATEQTVGDAVCLEQISNGLHPHACVNIRK